MNEAHDRPIRKFNPGTLQSDDEVVRQFVVRLRELDLVLDVLRGNLDSPSCQHVLTVAPRGRGKTMLLTRVGTELRTNADLTGRLFPVRFMEESQEVFTMADFWLETLFYLAQACAQAGDAEHSRDLLATHGDLTARWNDGATEERAHVAVLEAADRLGRRLVLMVENLQALSNAVDDDFGWKLRKTLQVEPRIVLLATATSRFKGLDDAAQPFFELFRIIDLEPLDTDECRRLWHMVSGEVGRRREIEPLRILTGGSPRLLAIVAELARHASLRQLLEDLVMLIDNHTEYFRGHLDVLAKTERRVYLAVIDLWQPSSTAEIAARARMDVRAASALLGRLVDRGAVLVEGTGRKRRYAAAERLYSIYYKLRRERGEAAIVRHLIQFMTEFYSDDELATLAVSDRGKARSKFRVGPDLQLEVARALVSKGIAHGKRGETDAELSAYDAVVKRFGDSHAPDLQVRVATALLCRGITHGQRGEADAELSAYDAVVERFGESRAPELQERVATAMLYLGITHGQHGEAEAELSAYDAVVVRFGDCAASDLQIVVAKALLNKGITHGQRGEVEAELAAYDSMVQRFGGSSVPDLRVQVVKALVNKGVTHDQRGETEAELSAYETVVERFGDGGAPDLQVQVAKALFYKGITHGQRGEMDAALDAYGAVIERFGDGAAPDLRVVVAKALLNKGIGHGQRGETEAELSAYEAVVEGFGNSVAPDLQVVVGKALINKGITHGQRGEAEAELSDYAAVVDRFGASDRVDLQRTVAAALVATGDRQVRIGRPEEALRTIDDLRRRCGAFTDEAQVAFELWRAQWVRAHALLVQGERRAALSSWRSMYGAFVDDARMLREMLARVPILLGAGAAARDLADVLAADGKTAGAAAPLIVALRQVAGQSVRAPAEVLEVAAHVRERIEAAVTARESLHAASDPRDARALAASDAGE